MTSRSTPAKSVLVRYAMAPIAVFVASLLWEVLARTAGPLPQYITFYPAVMLIAVACGFYPGLLATLLSAIVAAYWVIPPAGQFEIEDPADVTALVLFSGMGLFMSAVARGYQRVRAKSAQLAKELAVREADARLRFALQAAEAGAWEWDLRTNENVWSDELWSLYGLEPHSCEPSYEAWRQTVVPEDRARVEQAVQEAASRGEALRIEWRVNTPDGTERWLMARGQPVRDTDGQVVRFLGIVLDITTRKRAEVELHEADQRKNEFLAMLSHELRNPMAPVRNSLYVLEHAAPGGEQAQRALAVVDRQVEQMTRLIDDLLDVTRITRGKVKLKRERLDLNELTRSVVEDYRQVFAGGKVRTELVTEPGKVWVNGDRVRLAQVLGNLLQNAARFTLPSGRTSVVVRTDAVGQLAILTVRDTGKGIAADVMPRLFQAFVQTDDSLDRSQGGLGLGLALVKELVEMHGGSVRAESEGAGKGAAFTVSLPLDLSAAEPATPAHRPSGDSSPRRVLVIEDNVDAADSLHDALKLGGHVVEVAYRGRAGIETAKTFEPDVVICDIGLPEMDGYAVARALRADEVLGGIRLVALTGYAQPEDIARARAAGFDAHLAKPPTLEAIEDVLR